MFLFSFHVGIKRNTGRTQGAAGLPRTKGCETPPSQASERLASDVPHKRRIEKGLTKKHPQTTLDIALDSYVMSSLSTTTSSSRPVQRRRSPGAGQGTEERTQKTGEGGGPQRFWRRDQRSEVSVRGSLVMGGMKKLRDQGNSTQNSRHSGLEGRAKVRPDARSQMPSKRATKTS